MLVLEPKKRISAENALKHPWFKFTKTNETVLNKKIIQHLKSFHVSSSFQKIILEYIVNELDLKNLKELREAFLAIDTNRNGFITLAEFIEALSACDQSPKLKEYEEKFQELDQNKDGRINYSEFLAATLQFKGTINEEKLWSAFAHFDPSNSGKITPSSLKGALKRAGKKNIDADELIREVGLDHNGVINFEEFRKIVEGVTN